MWQDDLTEVVDDGYVDDHLHLVEPSPKPVTKKVWFADDLRSFTDPDPQPLSPVATSPTTDPDQVQP